jgi:GcrA cell cycle regulator
MEWTDARVDALKSMWLEGLSATQVARRLGGVTRSAVIGKVHRIGLAGRQTPARPRNLGGRPRRQVWSGTRTEPRQPAPLGHRSPPALRFVETIATATILTLADDHCRWPIGDPASANFGFCGRGQSHRGPYCPLHTAAATRHRPSAAGIAL